MSDPLQPLEEQPLTEYLSTEFRNEESQERYERDLSTRSIIRSKFVNFKGWESLEIKKMFDKIILHGIYGLKGDSCDRIVHLFYANLTSTEEEGCLMTYILGTSIVISPQMINKLIGFNGEGYEVERYYNVYRDCDFFRFPDGLEFLRKIHRNSNISKFVKPRTKDLNLKARVIHNMISYTLLPRDGHRDHVSCMDLYVMEKLYNKKMFDPDFLILSHMHEIGRKCNKNLPYGTLIQKIVEKAQIQLSIGELMRSHRSGGVFDRLNLIRMGLVEVNGTWVLKEDQGASTSRDLPMEDATTQPFSPKTASMWEKIEQKIEFLIDRVEELTNTQRHLDQSHIELTKIIMDKVEPDDDYVSS